MASWTALNGAKISVIADPTPLSPALSNSLQLSVPQNASGQVGFANSGYWGLYFLLLSLLPMLSSSIGIKVDPTWTYKASLNYRFPQVTSFSGSLTMSLRSSSGIVLASASLNISGSQTKWIQLNATLQAKAAPSDNNNVFCVTVDGADAANQTVNFALFSLFPPTYNDRENGMRIDIANVSN